MFETEIFKALILGIVQGLTEFLPISSSGHPILIPELLGWQGVVNSLSFDIALHFGSSVAVVAFFWRDWVRLVSALFKNIPGGSKAILSDFDSRLLLLLILGSIPAGLVGLLFEDYFKDAVRNPGLIVITMLTFALVLYAADHLGKKARSLESVTWKDAIVVGVSQCLALIPGVSRSGITISAGLFQKLDRQAATRFSFLLSTPIILAASLLSLRDIVKVSSEGALSIFLVGFVAAAVSGWVAIKILLNFVKSNNFNIFVAYRIMLGLGLLLWLFNS